MKHLLFVLSPICPQRNVSCYPIFHYQDAHKIHEPSLAIAFDIQVNVDRRTWEVRFAKEKDLLLTNSERSECE